MNRLDWIDGELYGRSKLIICQQMDQLDGLMMVNLAGASYTSLMD
jgi:hypothetical protein